MTINVYERNGTISTIDNGKQPARPPLKHSLQEHFLLPPLPQTYYPQHQPLWLLQHFRPLHCPSPPLQMDSLQEPNNSSLLQPLYQSSYCSNQRQHLSIICYQPSFQDKDPKVYPFKRDFEGKVFMSILKKLDFELPKPIMLEEGDMIHNVNYCPYHHRLGLPIKE